MATLGGRAAAWSQYVSVNHGESFPIVIPAQRTNAGVQIAHSTQSISRDMKEGRD